MLNKLPSLHEISCLLSNGLILIGSNSIFNILLKFPHNFELIVFPENYNSVKLKKLKQKAESFNIPVLFNSKLIKFVSRKCDSELTKTNVFAILKSKFNKYFSLNEILDRFKNKENLLCLAFYEIEYPQNVGAILRTAYAFDVDFVLVSNRQSDVFSNVITKVSMGANFLIPIVKENFFYAIDILKNENFYLIGLDLDGENIQNLLYNSRNCIFLGNEELGLSETVRKRMDKIVSIPINKGIDSLNVSVAAGIVLYDRILKYEFGK